MAKERSLIPLITFVNTLNNAIEHRTTRPDSRFSYAYKKTCMALSQHFNKDS